MLSIVIPVYNCKLYLENCLESLLCVKGLSYEVLLIDDGSTDGSELLCDILSEQYTCVRCFHQENHGVSATRNRGIDEAGGDWLMFLDADDSIDHDLLSKLLVEAENDTDLDAVLFGMSFDYYRHGKKYRSEQMSLSDELMGDKSMWAEKISDLYAVNYLSPVWNKLLKKSILKDNGLRFCNELFLLEDLEFSLRYLACCSKILCSNKIVYHYRQAEDEGNAGRRLLRIQKISSLVDRLSAAFTELAVSTNHDPNCFQIIVIGIFLMLARQKIAVSDRKAVGEICDDFIRWVHEREIPQDELSSNFVQDVLHRRVWKLIAKRDYTRLRHETANRIKYLRYVARGEK